MWYNTIPTVSLPLWLSDTVGLFSHILQAVTALPVLRLFLVLLLFLAVIGLLAYLLRQGRNGKM